MLRFFIPFILAFFYFLLSSTHGSLAISVFPDSLTAPAAEKHLDTLFNSKPLVVKTILIAGNKVTKPQIIFRELPFKINSTIPPGQLSPVLMRARQNLLNTALFNFVTITPYVYNDSVLDIKISVVERWYTWPSPLFELAETNFNTWWLAKDFKWVNYGLYVVQENFRGRKESIRFKAQGGYTKQFALQYNIPFLNKKQTVGASLTLSYFDNHEITLRTINNKRVFYNDKERPVRDEFYTKLLTSIRKGLYITHTFMLQYSQAGVADTVLKLSSGYFPNNSNFTGFLVTGYRFVKDRRDFNTYPLKGYILDAEAVQIGLGVFSNEPNLTSIQAAYKKYWRLNEKFFFASAAKARISLQNQQPYYLQRGLGYGDLVRAYEYYIIDGQNWALLKNNFKYQLINPSVRKFKFIPSAKFNSVHYAAYLNVFADAGYVSDKLYAKANPLANQLLFGYGAGLDFVTYYDRVLRLEYSFNRQKEHGFFVNFIAAF